LSVSGKKYFERRLNDKLNSDSILLDTSKKRWNIRATVSPELELLEKVLYFPEEVALALAETESQLFSQVRFLISFEFRSRTWFWRTGFRFRSVYPS